jgi:hypothetical protein
MLRALINLKRRADTKRLSILIRWVVSIAILLAVFFFLLWVGIATLNAVFNALDWGVKIGWIDIPTAVTIILVDGVIEFFGWLFRGKGPKPNLSIEVEPPYAVYVSNWGDYAAEACQAKLTLFLKSDDIVSGQDSIVDVPIRWFPVNREEVNIRPDYQGGELLTIFRVSYKDGKPTFDFPSIAGWESPLVSVKPAIYEGILKVSPMNAKALKKRFVIDYDKENGTACLTFRLLWV